MTSKKEKRKLRAKISRDTLSDSYIIDLLRKLNKNSGFNEGLTAADYREHPELIEVKRAQIMLWRAIYKEKNEPLK